MKYVILLLILWCSVHVQAQLVPGHMGRRLFLEGGATLGFRSNANSLPLQDGLYQQQALLLPRLNVDVGYVLSRKLVGRIGWSHLYFDVGSQHRINPGDHIFFEEEHQAVYAVYANDIHLDVDVYFSGRGRNKLLAPTGSYFSFGLRLIHTHRILTNGSYGITRHAIVKQQDPYMTVGFDFQYGYRTVIANRFLLSFGLASTVIPPNFASEYNQTYSYEGAQEVNNYQHLLRKGVFDRYILGAYLHLGVFLTR